MAAACDLAGCLIWFHRTRPLLDRSIPAGQERTRAPAPLVALAIACNIFGVFLHFASDAQKHFTLAQRKGLITDGFFARSRNPNYLGELLIYLSLAILAMHLVPYLVLAGFGLAVFLPNMRRKDISLSRYPEFEDYRRRTGLLLPKLWR